MNTPVYPEFLQKAVPACIIVGAGAFAGLRLPIGADDFVIAADGGYAYLKACGARCDLLMGDLDSLAPETEIDTDTKRFNPIKDDTDTMLALRYGMEHGYRRFVLYGVFGGRFDHTAATLQSVMWACGQGAEIIAFEDKDDGTPGAFITAVKNGTMRFPAGGEGYLSLFALNGPARGITLKNLKYELSDSEMVPDTALGVSNEFLAGKSAEITVKDGMLLVIKP